MNDIKEDLALMELERLEYFNYFILILKNNIFNFLFVIVIMILLNTLIFYERDLAFYFSESFFGEHIYKKLNNFGKSLIDDGLGIVVMKLGLYYRGKEFIEGFASYIKWLCYIGITISTCKYIESNLKTNPVFEIIKSFFRIGKLTFIILITGILVSEFGGIIFRNKIIYFFSLYLSTSVFL